MARGKKTGGRRPGSRNKVTEAVKQALNDAFRDLGGTASLVKWGKKNPNLFYPLWVKLLPTEIKNADGQPFQINVIEQVVDVGVPEVRPEGNTAGAQTG